MSGRFDAAELTLPRLPCGGVPVFDQSSGISYRCDQCFAVIGSIGMPRQCREAMDAERKEQAR